LKYERETPQKGGALPSSEDNEHNLKRKMRIKKYSNIINELERLKSDDSKSFTNFDWKLDFPEVLNPFIVGNDAGFDIVIGNPPYVGEKGNSQIFDELKKIPKWERYYRRRSNTYYFFIKQGIELLNRHGV
jgi:type I restriction-modification system DNA methylase subunit